MTAARPLPDERDVRRRIALASVQLIRLRNELDALTADLSWLHVTAAGGPDLGDDLR